MDSICVEHFTCGCCNKKDCPNAHRLSELSNPENWVIFHAPGLELLDFLPYKYQSHHFFRSIPLPGTGPLVRFASAEDAATVAREYQQYYSPAHLPDVLNQASVITVEEQSSRRSADVAALDALCRRELRMLSRRSTKVLSPGSSFCLSSPSCSPLPLGVLGSPDNLSFDNFGLSLSTDDISSECLSSDSSPSTPLERSLSLATMRSAGSPGGALQRRPMRPGRAGQQKTDRSAGIIGVLQAQAARGPGFVGWTALEELWGITPACLDDAVLTYLARKMPAEQEQILLSFAAIDLGTIQNLSAYLNCLIKEHETTSQVCLHFLAGLCDHHDDCRYIHPVNTAGWELLQSRWGISYRDFDYAVLNYLSKKPVYQQDEILSLFADMNLKAVKNRSAYLSSMIERYERVGLRKRTRARGKTIKGKPAEAIMA